MTAPVAPTINAIRDAFVATIAASADVVALVDDRIVNQPLEAHDEADLPCVIVYTRGGSWRREGTTGSRYLRSTEVVALCVVELAEDEDPLDAGAVLATRADTLAEVVVDAVLCDSPLVRWFAGPGLPGARVETGPAEDARRYVARVIFDASWRATYSALPGSLPTTEGADFEFDTDGDDTVDLTATTGA